MLKRYCEVQEAMEDPTKLLFAFYVDEIEVQALTIWI